MKQVELKGYLFQDVSSSRQPIMMITEDGKKKVSLEKLLSDTGLIPTLVVHTRSRYHPYADHAVKGDKGGFSVDRTSAKNVLKKVKVTVTIEEIL